MKQSTRLRRLRHNRGATAVEFALVAAFGGFFILLLGTIEVARVLYYMNSANEATELGARLAVVCDANSSLIKQRMRQILPLLTDDNITVEYFPQGCAANASIAREDCDAVKVSIASGLRLDTVIPFVAFGFDMPAFATVKTREAMDSTNCS